jgi:hypothetical protein
VTVNCRYHRTRALADTSQVGGAWEALQKVSKLQLGVVGVKKLGG